MIDKTKHYVMYIVIILLTIAFIVYLELLIRGKIPLYGKKEISPNMVNLYSVITYHPDKITSAVDPTAAGALTEIIVGKDPTQDQKYLNSKGRTLGDSTANLEGTGTRDVPLTNLHWLLQCGDVGVGTTDNITGAYGTLPSLICQKGFLTGGYINDPTNPTVMLNNVQLFTQPGLSNFYSGDRWKPKTASALTPQPLIPPAPGASATNKFKYYPFHPAGEWPINNNGNYCISDFIGNYNGSGPGDASVNDTISPCLTLMNSTVPTLSNCTL